MLEFSGRGGINPFLFQVVLIVNGDYILLPLVHPALVVSPPLQSGHSGAVGQTLEPLRSLFHVRDVCIYSR